MSTKSEGGGRKSGQLRPVPPGLRQDLAAFVKTKPDYAWLKRKHHLSREQIQRYARGVTKTTTQIDALYRIVGQEPPVEGSPQERMLRHFERLVDADPEVADAVVLAVAAQADAAERRQEQIASAKDIQRTADKGRQAALADPLAMIVA